MRYDDASEKNNPSSSPIQKFEDLIAWQHARKLTFLIYKTTSQGNFSKDFGLKDQIRRAAVSIMSNIAEGYEREGPNEFHRFLTIAKASCAEVRSQLYVAFDVEYLKKQLFEDLMQKGNEVARILGGLRKSVDIKRRNK
jgi:four helix bundle protein